MKAVVAAGFSYHMGWSCYALVVLEAGRVISAETGRIETGEPGDRESVEPYHVAGGWQGLERVAVPGKPEDIVRRGLARQARITGRNIDAVFRGRDIACAGVLVGRGRRAASLSAAINSHAQIHVAESFAVCDAIQSALGSLGVRCELVDRRSLFELAQERIGIDKDETMAALKLIPVSGAWRQEEKQSALAAWVATLTP